MPQTIGNPLSWSYEALRDVGHYLGGAIEHLAGTTPAQANQPAIRRLAYADIETALRRGLDDFAAFRSDVIALCLLYPLIGVGLVALALDRNFVPLIFPTIAGFALVGPVAAVGLYEMSRRREAGEEPRWIDAFAVIRNPKFGAIFLLGLLLVVIFLVWLAAAQGIYALTLGPEPPESIRAFLGAVFTTPAGWAMIVIGIAVGALFAGIVLVISVVSFPLLLDRDDATLAMAVVTSVRVAAHNPRPIATWGLIVAAALAIGSLPVFLGLIVVVPVLGHATWHLYRRAVVPADAATAAAAESHLGTGHPAANGSLG